MLSNCKKEMVAVDNRKNFDLSQNGTLSSTQYCSLTTGIGSLKHSKN